MWTGTCEAFIHPCKALHLVNTKGQGTCNLASPAPVLTTVPSLPPAVQGWESCAWGGVSRSHPATAGSKDPIHSPCVFAHPGASEMIPFQCLARAAPKGRAWCFLNCSNPPGRQHLDRSLVLSSYFTPGHYLLLLYIK